MQYFSKHHPTDNFHTAANVTMGSNITVPISPYTHLCAYLQPAYLEAFNIDSDRVRTALCAASNLTLIPPAPSNTSALNDTLLDTSWPATASTASRTPA